MAIVRIVKKAIAYVIRTFVLIGIILIFFGQFHHVHFAVIMSVIRNNITFEKEYAGIVFLWLRFLAQPRKTLFHPCSNFLFRTNRCAIDAFKLIVVGRILHLNLPHLIHYCMGCFLLPFILIIGHSIIDYSLRTLLAYNGSDRLHKHTHKGICRLCVIAIEVRHYA